MFYGSAKQTAAGLFCYCKMWGDHSKSSLFTCTQEGKAKKCCRSIHIYIICLRLFPHFILLPFYYHAWYLKVLLCSMYDVRVAIWFTEDYLKKIVSKISIKIPFEKHIFVRCYDNIHARLQSIYLFLNSSLGIEIRVPKRWQKFKKI